jgi:signal peptidase I
MLVLSDPPYIADLADWAFSITLFLLVASAIAQPLVIPAASMETTLMTGDHLLVGKLVFAPHGSLARRLLPYADVKRGDIIVFRWPVDISQTYVQRVTGVTYRLTALYRWRSNPRGRLMLCENVRDGRQSRQFFGQPV